MTFTREPVESGEIQEDNSFGRANECHPLPSSAFSSSSATDRRGSPILVLGLGNELLKDDGVGIEAVRRLREILDHSIGCVETSEAGLALMDFLVGHDKAVIVDAVLLEPKQAGEIFEWDLSELGQASAFSPHYAGLSEIRDFARWLAVPFPKEVRVFAVAVKDPFTIGEPMSPEVEAALAEVVQRVKTTILRWCTNNAGEARDR